MQQTRGSKWIMQWIILVLLGFSSAVAKDFRPPAVPLIANSPYFSVWSMADRLTDDATRHWTGTPQELSGLVRIDGKPYRIIGNEPEQVPAMEQRKVQVLPTRTIYQFEAAGVAITLTFMTPTLPADLDVMSRPVTYVTWTVQSKDGKRAFRLALLRRLRTACRRQHRTRSCGFATSVRRRHGSARRQRAAAHSAEGWRLHPNRLGISLRGRTSRRRHRSSHRQLARSREGFAKTGSIPASDAETPQPAGDWDGPTLAYRFDLGKVGSTPVSRYVVLAYDESFSVQYLDRWLRPYWRRNGATIAHLLEQSMRDYEALTVRCRQFDEELMADLSRVGGEDYALLAALSYRESFAAQGLAVDYDGTPLSFPKENSSCGCISTVDVIYPAAPILLLFNTTLLKASMTPVLTYAETYHWPFRWAPHDLGIYPHANGHDYPADVDLNSVEDHMPVEESANMILMAAAIAKSDGNADYAAKYWPLFSKWAKYLEEKGLDPEKQIVTDDFTGPLAHNANLSVKAISALGAYADTLRHAGQERRSCLLPQTGPRGRSEMVANGRRWRPFPFSLRPARHLEPEIQSHLGQGAGPEYFSPRSSPYRDRLLQNKTESLRPSARFSRALHETGLAPLDRDARRQLRRFRCALCPCV